MILFVTFVFAAVTLGAGSMLSPAWPTLQPRIGLAGALSLGLVVGGAIFNAELFGWSTLVIDYLLFALLTGIFLGGTLSHAQARAEAKGEALADRDQGWPGPEDLAFFGIAALILIIPLLILPVPPGAEAPISGLMSLTTRLGSTFDTLAPLYPDQSIFNAPGLHALAAYLSQQLRQPVALIHMIIGTVAGFLSIVLAYDAGAEIRQKRLGRAMALFTLPVMLILSFRAEYSVMIGLLFGLACLLYTLRFWRHAYPADALGAGLMLGAVLLSDPTMTPVIVATFAAFTAALLTRKRPAPPTLAVMTFGIPIIALIGTAPWLLNHFGQLVEPNSPYVNPGKSAPYALILPVITAGGIGLLWLWENQVPPTLRQNTKQSYYLLAGFAATSVILMILAHAVLLKLAQGLSTDVGALATWGDVQAMLWLRDNTPADARLLNYPLEGDWAPAIAERYSVFYAGMDITTDKTAALLNFWNDPAAESSREVLEAAKIDYVLVPQSLSQPDLSLRWQPIEVAKAASQLEAAAYLQLVFEQDGAQVYRVMAP